MNMYIYIHILCIYLCVYIYMYINIILLQITIMSCQTLNGMQTSGFERAHSIGGLVGKRLESSPNCSEALWTAEKPRSCARNRIATIRTCKVTSRFWTSVQKISTLFVKRLNQSHLSNNSWLIQILQELEVLADAVSSIFYMFVES